MICTNTLSARMVRACFEIGDILRIAGKGCRRSWSAHTIWFCGNCPLPQGCLYFLESRVGVLFLGIAHSVFHQDVESKVIGLKEGINKVADIRLPSASAKSICLVLGMALLILTTGSCRPQSVEQAAGTQPGEALPGIEFLKRRSPEHIRVMSFNVGWDSIFPDDDPQNDRWRQDSKGPEFVRILKAVEPDIICLQEINSDRDPQQVGDILDAALPLGNDQTWQTHSGRDNVIAARFELALEADRVIHSGSITNIGHAMALVDLPDAEYENDLYLICAHFKSQGGQANIRARQEHADAIIAWIGDAKSPGGEVDLSRGTAIVVLGDLNVYDTDPAHHLTTLLSGDIENEDRYGQDLMPDWDETGLADVLPRHNGVGEDVYTWRDDTQEFNPGALDRILYTDSVISVENAFVLNTVIMTEEALEAVGLKAGDVVLDPETGRYDHLPLAVDVSFQDMPTGQ
jgi:endonuclease/exonuclease/phosphatase family metal-dependent hydrolase